MTGKFFLKAAAFLWMVSLSAGIGNSTAVSAQKSENAFLTEQKEGETSQKMKIQIGNQFFTVDLYENDTVEKFVQSLPVSMEMKELNQNEKYDYLDAPLPANSEKAGWINAGEIMLYGSDCLVLFYDSFSTPYSYTRIGMIENIDGLKEALGDGSVTVTFSMAEAEEADLEIVQ